MFNRLIINNESMLIRSDLHEIAKKCYEIGYYTYADYQKFCEANAIKTI